jgi:DNA-binding TFAR19-related protein (PDSD5 family)
MKTTTTTTSKNKNNNNENENKNGNVSEKEFLKNQLFTVMFTEWANHTLKKVKLSMPETSLTSKT